MDYSSDYDSDFDTEFDYDYDFDTMPTSWSYQEIWLIPGPFSGVGPQGYQRSDERIREDINERLTQHGRLNARDIQVEVKDGEATITGTVESRQASESRRMSLNRSLALKMSITSCGFRNGSGACRASSRWVSSKDNHKP